MSSQGQMLQGCNMHTVQLWVICILFCLKHLSSLESHDALVMKLYRISNCC